MGAKMLLAKGDNYTQAKYILILQTMEYFSKALEENDKCTMNVKQYFDDMVFMLDLCKEMHRVNEELRQK